MCDCHLPSDSQGRGGGAFAPRILTKWDLRWVLAGVRTCTQVQDCSPTLWQFTQLPVTIIRG